MGLREKVIGFALKNLGGKEGKAVWNWLNGKKLAIGLTCEALGHLVEAAVPYVEPILTAWGVSAQGTAGVLKFVGYCITALGAGHKFVKEL
jgi:hypothetical protein